ncbi:MAG: Gfo/Idh/MocA family oxidoreductase [Clostridia bacterium]|nr:Gfo/Idh/MocA family oxidoreductase [Clostridia bacterium]
MEKVRFGIIGVGNIGLSHVKHLLAGRITNGVLGAVCDLKPNKLNNVNGLEGGDKVAKFSDYKELLASGLVDCVIVAVPHFLHPSICIEALNAGLHVICEKPAGVYTKQVKEMNAVAEKSDQLFTMMFNQRTNELYQQMHDIVHSGGIGEIKRVNWIITNWYRPQSYYDSGDWRATWSGEGGGVLMNQCPHQIDLLQWIVGMLPTRVHSFCHWGKWHDIEVEDDVTAYFEYENGATGVFVTSTGDTPGTNRFEILGDKGKLICENGKLTYYKLKVSEREFNATYKGGFGEPEKEEIELPAPAPCPQHVGIMNNFANAILGLEPLMVNGLEGLRGVQITDAMLLSSWLGETVTLPIDDDLYLAELNKRIATSRRKVASDTVLSTDGTY